MFSLPHLAKDMADVEVLNLSSNPNLREIDFKNVFSSLPALQKIILDDCPSLQNPPPEHILEGGPKAVCDYYKDWANGSVTWNRVKILCLGDGRIGKTYAL